MMMPAALASKELTTLERIEGALVVIASAMTGKRPQQLFPWIRHG